jgi:hypothetical protein
MSGGILLLFFTVASTLFNGPEGSVDRKVFEEQQIAAAIGQEKKPDSSGPICQVTREAYVQSPGPRVAAIVGVRYLGSGLFD